MKRHAILYLTERQLEVIRLRDEEKLTFTEIGNRIGVTGGRASQIYKTAIRKRKSIEQIDKNDPNVKFRDLAARNLPTSTWNSLMAKHKLDSKETFLSMTDEDILNLRNVGFKGVLEIQKFMKMLGKDIESEEFPFRDEDIDPEMLDIVKNFNRAGIETMFCCQGHFNESNDGGGICIPYLSTKLPDDNNMLVKILRMHKDYTMVNINIVHSCPYTKELEEFTTCDKYIDIINDNLDKCNNSMLEFRINPIFYNLAENLYDDNESHEKIFEYLRKKFISELQKISDILLKDSAKKGIMKKMYLY